MHRQSSIPVRTPVINEHSQHGPEDLLSRDDHVVGDVAEDGRLNVVALHAQHMHNTNA